MSNTVMIDRYRVIKKYREAGLNEDQAELYTEALVIAVNDQVATKQDIHTVRSELSGVETSLRQEIAAVRSELKQEIAEVRSDLVVAKSELRQEMQAMENRLLLRLGVLTAASVGASTAILGFLIALF